MPPNNIVRLSDHKPHLSGIARCVKCAHEWEATQPVPAVDPLECPACGLFHGYFKFPITENEGVSVYTCGNCGGPVKVPAAWYATIPPTPTCAHCGATARMNHGPVLPMEQPKRLAPRVDEFWNGKLPPAG